MKKIPQCGIQRYVKVGTHSGQRVYVRPCKSRRGSSLIVGSHVDMKENRERYEKWQGPLKIWMIGPDPKNRLFLEWS